MAKLKDVIDRVFLANAVYIKGAKQLSSTELNSRDYTLTLIDGFIKCEINGTVTLIPMDNVISIWF